jgi:hypothetical protein
MSDCCNKESSSFPKKQTCPVNGKEYSLVDARTITHHIKEPWNWTPKHQGYYFCDDPDCDVVYFGQDASVVTTTQLRTEVGVKHPSDSALICYCFGVSMLEASQNESIKQFVMTETKSGNCACEVRNPSGRCCLKDFS